MSVTIDFTFQVLTPESADQGDYDRHGFITQGYWKYDVDDYERNVWRQGDLRSLIGFAQELGVALHPDAEWACSVEPEIDYATGEDTTYAMHIDGCTPSSYSRIMALLG